MSEFSIPYSKKESNKSFNKNDIQTTIRFAIAAKYESVQIYEEVSQALNDETASKLICEVITEEKKHIETFIKILELLNSFEEKPIQHF